MGTESWWDQSELNTVTQNATDGVKEWWESSWMSQVDGDTFKKNASKSIDNIEILDSLISGAVWVGDKAAYIGAPFISAASQGAEGIHWLGKKAHILEGEYIPDSTETFARERTKAMKAGIVGAYSWMDTAIDQMDGLEGDRTKALAIQGVTNGGTALVGFFGDIVVNGAVHGTASLINLGLEEDEKRNWHVGKEGNFFGISEYISDPDTEWSKVRNWGIIDKSDTAKADPNSPYNTTWNPKVEEEIEVTQEDGTVLRVENPTAKAERLLLYGPQAGAETIAFIGVTAVTGGLAGGALASTRLGHFGKQTHQAYKFVKEIDKIDKKIDRIEKNLDGIDLPPTAQNSDKLKTLHSELDDANDQRNALLDQGISNPINISATERMRNGARVGFSAGVTFGNPFQQGWGGRTVEGVTIPASTALSIHIDETQAEAMKEKAGVIETSPVTAVTENMEDFMETPVGTIPAEAHYENAANSPLLQMFKTTSDDENNSIVISNIADIAPAYESSAFPDTTPTPSIQPRTQ